MFHHNLREDLVQYMLERRHPLSQLLHMLAMPLLVTTLFVLLGYGKFFSWPVAWLDSWLNVNLGLLVTAVYLLFYFCFDALVTLSLLPLILFLYIIANVFRYFVPNAWTIALPTHVFLWLSLLLSQLLIERRSPLHPHSASCPASCPAAFLIAPLATYYQLLFRCGYRLSLAAELAEAEYAQINS
jgi:uncharacterized membrane protein YGL010W